MMEFVKVIRAKMGQYSPAKSGDFEKVGPKSFQFKESMFLSFLRTKSAENLFRVSGQTEANFMTLCSYWLTKLSKVSTNFGIERSWMRRPKLFVSSILFVAVSLGP